MQIVIDLIGSFLIFGWLLLMALRVSTSNNEYMQTYAGDLLVQENLVEATQLLEYDFRKIGFCKEPSRLPDPTKAIILADSTSIKFLTDVDQTGTGPDGIVDSLYYHLGPASDLPGTPNPNDRMLYRVVNDDPEKGANLGITSFTLRYYDSNGALLAFPILGLNLQKIQTVQITMRVESLFGAEVVETGESNRQFSSASWQQMRLSSRNYKNR